MKNLWFVLVLLAGSVVFFSVILGDQRSAIASESSLKQDPVVSPSIVTSPQDGKEQGFTVQVYSFLDSARAQKALESLKNSGYKAFMEVSDLGARGVFYRVRIGDLANEAEAQRLLEEIRKNYKDGFIAKKQK